MPRQPNSDRGKSGDATEEFPVFFEMALAMMDESFEVAMTAREIRADMQSIAESIPDDRVNVFTSGLNAITESIVAREEKLREISRLGSLLIQGDRSENTIAAVRKLEAEWKSTKGGI